MSLNISHNMIHSKDDYSAIERLRTVVGEFAKNEIKSLEEKYQSIEVANEIDGETQDLYLESIVTNLSVTSRLDRLCDELIILALYKKIEISKLKLFEFHYPKNNPSSYDEPKKQNFLLNRNGYSLEKVKNHSAIDELRCICNAIKHQGKVTSPLSKFNGWTKGEELSGLSDAYLRIAKDVPSYLVDFDRKIRPNNKQSTTS